MKISIYLFLIAALFSAGCKSGPASGKENVYAIIPAPVSIREMTGNFAFTKKSKIVLQSLNVENKLAADFLAVLIKNPTGIVLPVVQGNKASSGSVLMSIDTSVINNEGYTLL
jgi:hypothetical protein